MFMSCLEAKTKFEEQLRNVQRVTGQSGACSVVYTHLAPGSTRKTDCAACLPCLALKRRLPFLPSG